jgi:Undecaprenyl-phosphate galactose phosphotransferase WbaP
MSSVALSPQLITVRERRPRPHVTTAAIVIGDLLAVTLSAVASVLLVYLTQHQLTLHTYSSLSPFLCAAVLAYAAFGLYPGVLLNPVDELKQTAVASTIFYLGLGASSFLYQDAKTYSRAAFLIGWAFTLCAVPAVRLTLRKFGSRLSWWGYPVIVIGTRSSVDQVARLLRGRPTLGLRVVGMVLDDLDTSAFFPSPRLLDLVASARALYGVLSFPNARQSELRQIVLRYSDYVPRLLFFPELAGFSGLRLSATDVDGRLALEINNGLLLQYTLWIKSALDLSLALAAGLLLLPVLVVLMILVKLSSKGPVFYGHTRFGRGGRPFKAYKFRSMVPNGDEVLRKHLAENAAARMEWAANQKLKCDPRVTAVGRFLRVTSLDELPQLWNVINDDMSLVGPRPIVQDEAARYGEIFDVYKKVAPGITGLWQVSGRNLTTYAQRVALDEYYVRNWSVWLDLHILFRTVTVVATRRGAS